MNPALFLAAAVASGALVAQQPSAQPATTWVRPELVAPGSGAVVPVARSGAGAGVYAALDVAVASGGFERLPFARPVRELEFGKLPDGSLVVLAGGIREGLELYLFDPASRAFDRYDTGGGRRLRSGFGDGLGSWPLSGGAGLLLFAFEAEEAVQFRAVVGRRVLASRRLPIDCGGFVAELDPVSFQVRVKFRGGAGEATAELEFAHPIAPRLTVLGADGGRVDFAEVAPGEQAVRRLEFVNEGGRTLDAVVSVDDGFALGAAGQSSSQLRIEPGAAVEQDVLFVPRDVGSRVGRLRVESPAPAASASIELRGTAVAAPVPDPVAVVQLTPRGAATAAAPPADQARPERGPPPRLRRPDAVRMRARWRGVERVMLTIELAEADRRLDRLAVRVGRRPGEEQVVPVFRPGGAEFEVDARALDVVEVAAVGADGPVGWIEVGRIPPALRLDGPWVVVHAPADSGFELLEIHERDRAPSRVLRSWRGRTDRRGDARFDGAVFVGDQEREVRLQLMVIGSDGRAVSSGVLRLGARAGGSGGDRKN